MKIRNSYQVFAGLYAIAFAVSVSARTAPCSASAEAEKKPLDAFSTNVIDALTGAIADEHKRLTILRDAAALETPASAVDAMLSQRALLVVAGEALRNGDIRESREWLRSVPLESPVAVEAALLLADTYRVEGHSGKARDWYLRAGKQFPHELLALKGMLAAAHAMEEEAPGAAATLYDEVVTLARDNAARLDRVPEDESGLSWLLAADNPLPPALRDQLAHRMLGRGKQSAITLDQRRNRNRKELDCLLRQAQQVQAARNTLGRKQRMLKETLSRLRDRIDETERQVQVLQRQVEPGNLDERQLAIRQSLVATENERKRLRGQALFLQQNLERLPDILNRLSGRLNRMYDQYQQENEALGTSMESIFRNAVASLRNDFLNVAGSAQRDKAALLESSSD